jgi:hypothetical protein
MTETISNQIIVNDVRLGNCSLASPFKSRTPQIDAKTGLARKDKYHIDAILAEIHPQFPAIQAVIRGVATAKWKEKTQLVLDMIKGNKMRFCLQRGDLYRAGKPGYEGLLYISAGNEEQPTIVVSENGVNIASRYTPAQLQLPEGARGPLLTPAHPLWPYSGCRANVHLQFYTYGDDGNPGLGCSVLGVQFYNHGVRLGTSRVSSGSEFGIVPGAADGPPPSTPAQTGSSGLI